ncbi:MAG TPA: iron-sulfur cluster assembly accessory protein [Mycobacteriales bacterium]|nr:iron-sulfur cluster assembly accessory protein [Mycobacteriales bacterium]
MSGDALVTVTPAAVARAAALLARAGLDGGGLRVRVQSSGCEGFVALLDLAPAADPDELTIDGSGVPLFVDVASMLALPGATLDHRTTAHGAEFVWTHPSAEDGCACAEAGMDGVGEDDRHGHA